MPKFPVILSVLSDGSLSPRALYGKVKSHVKDVGEFVEILDCLYALGKIELDEESGELRYVD
ncbi:MAG: hypothetical protein Q4F00_02740 [bacterium]|nr:hypothetical protein [bacterium]